MSTCDWAQVTFPTPDLLRCLTREVVGTTAFSFLGSSNWRSGINKALSIGLLATGTRTASAAADCSSLLVDSTALIPNLKPYVARSYKSGTTFSTPDASPAYNSPVPNLAAFCRFGAEYNTSATSKFRFEVWLPSPENWNGRFAFVGNGGAAGGVNYPDMAIPMTKYGFAVASTDAGHNGTTADGSFAMGNPESQIDFGYRAVHMSTVFAKEITGHYYGKTPSYNYWIGCSSGGKQGMKSIQKYPEDFDGAITGAPAQWWPHLNGFTVHVNLLNANATTPGAVVPTSFFPILFQEVTSQCDKLDGVKDGVITNPRKCKPNLSNLLCGAKKPSAFVNSTTCLSKRQMVTVNAIKTNWTSSNGDFLFPTFEHGSEFGWDRTVNGIPYGPAPDYFSYQVLNKTTLNTLSTNENELQAMLVIADKTNPGDIDAMNPDLRPFFDRGGKLMQYHGFADELIPAGSSLVYYEKVRSFFNHTDLSDKYNLFMIPGLGHCRGGPGVGGFGGPSQRDLSLGGSGQSLKFDAEHDMILATIDWVEKGVTPKSLLATRWTGSNVSNGPEFTRLLCPYPREGTYKGGDARNATSYICAMPA